MEKITVVGELFLELASKQQWVNRVPECLPVKQMKGETWLWVDAHGNVMIIGEDFTAATELKSYPVKVYRLRRAADELKELKNKPMKETGIIFNTEMVKAYQKGRKTQTRRLKGLKKINQNPNIWAVPVFDPGTGEWVFTAEHGPGQQVRLMCPFGQAGDRLWVRETWVQVMIDHAHDLLEGWRENRLTVFKTEMHEDWMIYAKEKYGYKWKPSIHMPKSACRYFPEILSTRPERLQDISEIDAKAEGVERLASYLWKNYNSPKDPSTIVQELSNPVSSFESLWRSIHGNESWALNPWVWRIEFKPFQP